MMIPQHSTEVNIVTKAIPMIPLPIKSQDKNNRKKIEISWIVMCCLFLLWEMIRLLAVTVQEPKNIPTRRSFSTGTASENFGRNRKIRGGRKINMMPMKAGTI